MEYCHVCAKIPNCYLAMLDMRRNSYVGLLVLFLAASLKPLAHCQNVASLTLFYRYYFGRCLSVLVELVALVLVAGRFSFPILPVQCFALT